MGFWVKQISVVCMWEQPKRLRMAIEETCCVCCGDQFLCTAGVLKSWLKSLSRSAATHGSLRLATGPLVDRCNWLVSSRRP